MHCLFSTGIHGDVAAYGGGILGGGIHGKHQPSRISELRHPSGHHARLCAYGGYGFAAPWQVAELGRSKRIQLLGIDDRRLRMQRYASAGVAGTAAARNDGQAQLDAGVDHAGHLGLTVGGNDDAGIFHPPVRGIGHVRNPGHTVKQNVVASRDPGEPLTDAPSQLSLPPQPFLEALHSGARRVCELDGQRVLLGPHQDLVESMMQGMNQRGTPLGVLQQIVLDKGVSLHDPHVTKHFEEHAGRASGATLAAEHVQHLPHGLAE